MNKWISLKEQYPTSKQLVVTYNSTSYKPIALAFWECGYGFTNMENGRSGINVTHWMPLPEEMPKAE